MTITIREREVVGSARQIFRRQHSKPIWGYVESVLNAFTAVKDYEYAPHKVATITLKVPSDDGLSHDAWIEDCGIGFVRKYSYLEWKMGYDTTTEEYMREQEDPDCLNKMGIGLNSIAALSKIDTVEFRTVSKNEQGQEGGLVCRYHGYNQAWQIPAEPLSPEYVLGREAGELKTGTRVIIKDVKDVRMKDLENLLIEVFARKLGGKDGYAVGIRETPQDQYTILKRPSNGPIICTCSETVIGEIKNKYGHMVPVKADLHPVEKTADAKVRFLVKKIKLGMYENDYLMKGHIWCDAAEFKPDREGIVIDEYEKTYQQIDDLVMRYAEAYPFDKKSSDMTGVENIKSKKTWEQKLTENFLRYYDKFNDTLLRIKAQKQQSALDGEPIGKLTNVRRNTKHKPEERERCPDGQHWDPVEQKCVPIQPPKRTNKKHKHRTKTPRILSDEYDLSSIPQFKILRGDREGKSGFFVELEESTSILWMDTHFEWVRDNLESASPETIDLLSMMAIMKAVPENKDLSQVEFFSKLVEALQYDESAEQGR